MSTSNSLSQNGIAYGKLRSVAIDDTGAVIGSYSNGQQIALFKDSSRNLQ